jgi:hypothetical protein
MAKQTRPRRRAKSSFNPLVLPSRAPVAIIAPALTAAKRRQIATSLGPQLARLSKISGLRTFQVRSNRLSVVAVRKLLDTLEAALETWQTAAQGFPEQRRTARGSRWRWARHRRVLLPAYLERLVLSEETDASFSWRNGTLTVPLSALPLRGDPLPEMLTPRRTRAGLCLNTVHWRPAGTDDLRPHLLEALDSEDRPTLADNAQAREQIADAFWRAHWSAGTARQVTGKTFPVALLPVRRAPGQTPDEVCHETSTGILLGQSSVTNFILQRSASAGKLLFDPTRGEFSYTSDRGMGEAERSALRRLNVLGFFSRPSPDPTTRTVQVARLVPYRASTPVSGVFAQWEALAAEGLVAERPCPLMGFNSLHFLSFPEEFQSHHSAMNDPVSTLVIDGQWHAPPLLRRATLLVHDNGKASIRIVGWEDIVIESPLFPLPLVCRGGPRAAGIPTAVDSVTCPRGNAQIFTPWSVAATPSGVLKIPSFRPGRDRAFLIVGTEIVEDVRASQVTMPQNGWLLVLRHDCPGFDDLPERLMGPARAITHRWRRPADGSVRHAMACGPLLLAGGKAISPHHFEHRASGRGGEQFMAWEGRGTATGRRGVPPTRFALDVDHTRAPRTAVGITANGQVVFSVVDGRADSRHSVGLTLREMAQQMKEIGCRDALSLEGGESSALFLNHPAVRAEPLLPTLLPGLANRPADEGGQEWGLPLPLLLWTR